MGYDHGIYYKNDPSFGRSPLFPKEYSDFSQVARVLCGNQGLSIDLIIQGVSINYAEHATITPHIGDTYSSIFLGKSPARVSVSAVLPDYRSAEELNMPSNPETASKPSPSTLSSYGSNFGKYALMSAYMNMLRISAAARTKVMPNLMYKGVNISGPWTNISIVESSVREDHVVCEIGILAFQIDWYDEIGMPTSIDFTSGMLHLNTDGPLSQVVVDTAAGGDGSSTGSTEATTEKTADPNIGPPKPADLQTQPTPAQTQTPKPVASNSKPSLSPPRNDPMHEGPVFKPVPGNATWS